MTLIRCFVFGAVFGFALCALIGLAMHKPITAEFVSAELCDGGAFEFRCDGVKP